MLGFILSRAMGLRMRRFWRFWLSRILISTTCHLRRRGRILLILPLDNLSVTENQLDTTVTPALKRSLKLFPTYPRPKLMVVRSSQGLVELQGQTNSRLLACP